MEKYISLNLWPIRVIGVWYPENTSPLRMKIYSFMRSLTVASLLFILLPAGRAADGYLRRLDIFQGIETLAFLISATTVLSKTLNICFRRNKLRILLKRMSEIWLEASEEEVKAMTRFAKLGKNVTKLYGVLGFSSIVSFGAQPFLTSFLSTDYENCSEFIVSRVPFEGWGHLTPNNSQTKTIFGFVFTGHVIAGALATVASVGHDCLFVVLILHVCASLRAIGSSLTESKFFNEDEDLEKRITRCGRKFQNLIEYTKELENILSLYLLAQSLCSTIVICLTGFLVSRDIQMANKAFFKYASYWFTSLFQLFIFCWAADRLQTEANMVGRSAYDAYGKLMSLDLKNHEGRRHLHTKISRYLKMILLRSQAPPKITAGNFYVMSLENYKNMLSSSYSYFTLLRAFAADKKT